MKENEKKGKLNKEDVSKVSGGIKNVNDDGEHSPGFDWFSKNKRELQMLFKEKFGIDKGIKKFCDISDYVNLNTWMSEKTLKDYIQRRYGIDCYDL